MKKPVLLMIAILIISFSFGQNSIQEPLPKADVTKSEIQADTVQFSFTSNYYIDTYKAPMLEGRMLNRYSEIIDIRIDSETQVVTFKTLTVGSNEFLETFVKHFKYSGYEIH